MTDTPKVVAPWDAPTDQNREAIERAGLAKLREKFPASVIGKLPRATSRDAKPGKCRECGGWHKLPATHLDYVGHADVTDRLLSADPHWNWAPVAIEEDGTPRFVRAQGGNPVGLWIKLTVCGVTRLGFGSVDGMAFDPEKQLIGDALRNAAMRFGVALNLWSKAELESSLDTGEVVDKATGEVKPAGESPSPFTGREQEEIDKTFGATTQSPELPPSRRVVLGIPIHTAKTWAQAKTLPLGGKGPYQAKTLGDIVAADESEDPDDREMVEHFEGVVVRAISDLWNRMTPKKKADGVGLTSECALLAYLELMKLRAPPPEDDWLKPMTEKKP